MRPETPDQRGRGYLITVRPQQTVTGLRLGSVTPRTVTTKSLQATETAKYPIKQENDEYQMCNLWLTLDTG